MEIKQSEIHTTAHEEARLSVETQLDQLLREKASLMIERKRFEDEKASDTSLRLAISEMRGKHREMENEISDKEDQINALKTTLLRLQNSLVAEDKDVSKVRFISTHLTDSPPLALEQLWMETSFLGRDGGRESRASALALLPRSGGRR
jgi:seryl-tRNA synthetase